MIYCMSDIHGEYQRYLDMLARIAFSEKDTLYILGDCIDRGPCGIDVLLDVMERSNVKLLLGNHEDMMLAAMGNRRDYAMRRLWQQNGGKKTMKEFLYHRTPEEQQRILDFIRDLPDCLDVEVGGQRFHLVHGFPAEDLQDRIWGRPEPGGEPPVPGVTVVVGHTPTVYLQEEDGGPWQIWRGDGVICIDCGCGSPSPLRRLACLRLDDGKEFYV